MVTKGIVTSIVDNYTVKVRLPRLDRIENTSVKTSSQNLREAIMCTPPNCRFNLQLGDIVFVELDDQNEDEAIILGMLSYENMSSSYSDFILNDLTVQGKCILPANTIIGEVTGEEIGYLKGLNKNLQYQIQALKDEISALKSDLQLLINEVYPSPDSTNT